MFFDIYIFLMKAVMAVAMGLALNRLRQWQKTVAGIFCHEKLMMTHWISFLIASVLDEVAHFVGMVNSSAADSISVETHNAMQYTQTILMIITVIMLLLV